MLKELNKLAHKLYHWPSIIVTSNTNRRADLSITQYFEVKPEGCSQPVWDEIIAKDQVFQINISEFEMFGSKPEIDIYHYDYDQAYNLALYTLKNRIAQLKIKSNYTLSTFVKIYE